MKKKYEFTDEQHPYRLELRRIRALVDIPHANVRAGDLGGWIEHEENLQHDGAAWVRGEAQVYGDAMIFGNAGVYGTARVAGDAMIYGNARVRGNALAYGTARIYGDARVYGNVQVNGNARVFGDAQVYGKALVFGDARVYGKALVLGTTRVYGDAEVFGTAQVYGDSEVFGAARVSGTAQVLHALVQASMIFPATLFKTSDEAGHHLIIGCWEGSVPGFRAMIESDRWVNATPAEIEKHRPELLAFTAMCEARMQTWGGEGEER